MLHSVAQTYRCINLKGFMYWIASCSSSANKADSNILFAAGSIRGYEKCDPEAQATTTTLLCASRLVYNTFGT